VSATTALAVIGALAVWIGSLYLHPFGACPRCGGTGHVKRGPRRRPACPRCHGIGRVQHPGSRTVHQLARRIRDGRHSADRYQHQEDSHENP
jgi:DnaJ-class molecular chaperone